jgi:hypothetical protein
MLCAEAAAAYLLNTACHKPCASACLLVLLLRLLLLLPLLLLQGCC